MKRFLITTLTLLFAVGAVAASAAWAQAPTTPPAKTDTAKPEEKTEKKPHKKMEKKAEKKGEMKKAEKKPATKEAKKEPEKKAEEKKKRLPEIHQGAGSPKPAAPAVLPPRRAPR